jgi:predicted metal-dependent HD superfamily phosphohydrolase
VEPHHLAPAWLVVCRAAGARDDIAGAGSRLLAAYGDPRRRYHDLHHLADVLSNVDTLAAVATDPEAVRLAAWFHDAVYDVTAGDNEERSAVLAEHELAQLRVPDAVVEEVARLVRLTATHDPEPDDRDGAVLCDADLAVLGRDRDGYAAYANAVRQEYAHVPDELFRAGRAAILRALLDQPTLFKTAEAIDRWEQPARRNVTAEIALLEAAP